MEPNTSKPENVITHRRLTNKSFQNILNFRDVGATVNAYTGQNLLRKGLLFRSARPDEATQQDRDELRDHYGIRTVMDLRSKTEHLNAARKRDAESKTPTLLQSNAALAEPVKIKGLEYHEIKVTGRRFEMFLVWQLSWSKFLRLIVLMLCGYRNRAIAIIGHEVMRPRGLIGLGKDTLICSTTEIREALEALVDPSPTATPILIHCTYGKDRTGLIVMLVLLILDVPTNAIAYDHKLTDEELAPERETRLEEIREMGMPEEFATTAPGFVESVVDFMDEEWGGIDGYCDHIGFGKAKRQELRDRFTL